MKHFKRYLNKRRTQVLKLPYDFYNIQDYRESNIYSSKMMNSTFEIAWTYKDYQISFKCFNYIMLTHVHLTITLTLLLGDL